MQKSDEMSFQVKGKLHKKFDTENKTETFQAREFVIVVSEGNYPQYIKFQLTQDRCGLIDNFEESQEIEVFFDLRGREWNEKYFTNLNAWKVQPIQEVVDSSFPDDSQAPSQEDVKFEDFDDLPF